MRPLFLFLSLVSLFRAVKVDGVLDYRDFSPALFPRDGIRLRVSGITAIRGESYSRAK